MHIYIKKAGTQGLTSAKDTDKTEEEQDTEYEESFSRRRAGVASSASPDLPGKGRKINEKTKKSARVVIGGRS